MTKLIVFKSLRTRLKVQASLKFSDLLVFVTEVKFRTDLHTDIRTFKLVQLNFEDFLET
jgi:hypothetical protein